MEKVLSIAVPLFCGGGLLFLLISAHTAKGIFKNYYSLGCARAHAKSKLFRYLGYISLALAGYAYSRGAATGQVGYMIAVFVGLAHAFVAFRGYLFDTTPEEEAEMGEKQ